MSAALKRAKRGVAAYLESLQRHETWVDANIQNATLAQVRVRLSDIVNNYEWFLKGQMTVDLEDETDANTTRATVSNLYFVLRPQLEEKVEELTSKTTPKVEQCNLAPTLNARLPEIALTTFSGDIMQWCAFIECFDSLVHSNPALTTIAKFQYLKHSLKDAASHTIESLDFTEENYEIARHMLKERFHKPNRICEHHIKWLFTVKALEKPCPRRLMELLDGFNSHLRSLTTLHRPTEQWTDLIVFLLASKFDGETKEKWHEAAPADKMSNFTDISNFIKQRCSKLELAPIKYTTSTTQAKSTTSTSNNIQSRLQRVHNSTYSYHASSNRYHCCFCNKSSHSILRCFEFLKLSISDRRVKVKQNGLCFNCLRPGHTVDKCPVQDVCKTCQLKHHTLLHLTTQTPDASTSTSMNLHTPTISKPQSSENSMTAAFTSIRKRHGPSHVFLATAMVRVLDNFGCPIIGRALLDSGSQLNFMSQAFASKLRLPLQKMVTEIGGIGSSTVQSSASGWIHLQSLATNFSTELEVLVLPTITNIAPSIPINIEEWAIPANLRLADPAFANIQNIDLLIGAELYFELLKVGQVQLGDNLPCLQNTVLGWIISGRFSCHSSNNSSATGCQVSLLTLSTSTISDDIERFWKLETITEGSKLFTTKDHPCDKHFVERFTRSVEGRYIVRLPFIRSPTILGDSSTMAMRRFFNIEKRLCRNQKLHAAYKAFINEYLALGHMERVPEEDIPESNYYLPHHCVLKPDSSTTKLRVVFDGSAKTSSGYSLNDILMVGPVVQNDLVSVLCRFRSHKYAFSADVSKMYRQIRMHHDDSNYQLIYWRNNPRETLQTYRLNTVTYGTSAAPFLATRCLVQCAVDNQNEHRAACDAIRHDMYVDDLLTGANSITDARHLRTSIANVLTTCGMELRKWCANSADIIDDVPQEHREHLMQLNNDHYIKTLGLLLQPQRDVFQFRVQPTSSSSKLTKRIVISEIARLFDPLGMLSPVIILAKIFMQKLWQLKLDWDEALPMNYYTYWQSFRSSLDGVYELSIPRFLFGNNALNSHIELHGFADASESAYGAAVYTRCAHLDGCFIVRLLCSKSRVAPLQKSSIPRLELCAALLLAQLMSQVRTSVDFSISDIFYWTDSTIVLHWLKSSPSALKTFVANRVSAIQELTDTTHWRHIESKQNPADVVSRGMMPAELIKCELWFSGPPILRSSEASWLTSNILPCIEPECDEYKKSTTLIVVASEVDSMFCKMKYLNSYGRLTKVMAYASRFLHTHAQQK